MARMSVFSSPLLLGFDHIERMLDQVNKTSAEGYPPYNIEKIGDHQMRISLAVAGFSDEDLSVTLEDNKLIIRGKSPPDLESRVFLHRGIASRQFTRSFVLAEGIEVLQANQENGLLHVDLEQITQESKIKEIKIGSKNKLKNKLKAIDVDT